MILIIDIHTGYNPGKTLFVIKDSYANSMIPVSYTHLDVYKRQTLYCGEFGVIDQAPVEDTLRWFTDVDTVFRQFGIGCAVLPKQKMFWKSS